MSPALLPRRPWHAAIYHQSDGSDPIYRCGGTLISRKVILTAVACAEIDVRRIFISLGRFNLGANETSDQTFQVKFVLVRNILNELMTMIIQVSKVGEFRKRYCDS